MRAASIVMVVLYHESPTAAPGWLGVTMFFVLSGFLITRMLLEEVDKSGTISLRNFYKRRSMRIFPAFYLCWVVTTLALVLADHQRIVLKQAAASFFYLTDYERALLPPQQMGFHMGISWSLAIEEQFYLLWPLGLLWAIRSGRQVSVVIVTSIAAIWMWRVVLMFGFHVGWGYLYNAFDTRADALLIGCWLACVMDRRGWSAVPLRIFHSRWLVLGTLFALAVLVQIDRSPMSYQWLLLASFTLEPVLCGLLLLQLLFWGSVGWKFLEHRVVKLIARLSYSIYLYHPPVLEVTGKIPIRHHSMIAIPSILAVAALSYYLVERPIMKMRDRGRPESVLLDDGLPGAVHHR